MQTSIFDRIPETYAFNQISRYHLPVLTLDVPFNHKVAKELVRAFSLRKYLKDGQTLDSDQDCFEFLKSFMCGKLTYLKKWTCIPYVKSKITLSDDKRSEEVRAEDKAVLEHKFLVNYQPEMIYENYLRKLPLKPDIRKITQKKGNLTKLHDKRKDLLLYKKDVKIKPIKFFDIHQHPPNQIPKEISHSSNYFFLQDFVKDVHKVPFKEFITDILVKLNGQNINGFEQSICKYVFVECCNSIMQKMFDSLEYDPAYDNIRCHLKSLLYYSFKTFVKLNYIQINYRWSCGKSYEGEDIIIPHYSKLDATKPVGHWIPAASAIRYEHSMIKPFYTKKSQLNID